MEYDITTFTGACHIDGKPDLQGGSSGFNPKEMPLIDAETNAKIHAKPQLVNAVIVKALEIACWDVQSNIDVIDPAPGVTVERQYMRSLCGKIYSYDRIFSILGLWSIPALPQFQSLNLVPCAHVMTEVEMIENVKKAQAAMTEVCAIYGFNVRGPRPSMA